MRTGQKAKYNLCVTITFVCHGHRIKPGFHLNLMLGPGGRSTKQREEQTHNIGGGGFHLYASAEPRRGTGEEGEQEEVRRRRGRVHRRKEKRNTNHYSSLNFYSVFVRLGDGFIRCVTHKHTKVVFCFFLNTSELTEEQNIDLKGKYY